MRKVRTYVTPERLAREQGTDLKDKEFIMTPFIPKSKKEYKDDSWREKEEEKKRAKMIKRLPRRVRALRNLGKQPANTVREEREMAEDELDLLKEEPENVASWNGIGPLTGERYLQLWKEWHLENTHTEDVGRRWNDTTQVERS